MSEKLTTTIEQRRSGARVIKLAGVLDEHNRLRELVEKVGSGPALINLSGVERMNSTGTRDWVNWLAQIEARGTQPILIACSPAVVAQLNRIKNFAGAAQIKSFQVPYHCAACGLDKLLLVNISEMGNAPHSAPRCTCDACGGAMAFADESGSYFAFVQQVQQHVAQRDSERDSANLRHRDSQRGSERDSQRGSGGQLARDSQRGSGRDLARGSRRSVDPDVSSVSKPRTITRDSRPSLSVFQLPENKRPSEHTMPRPRQTVGGGAIWVVAIVLLVLMLLGAVGVFAYLLLF